MALIIRILLLAGAGLATIFVARDATNFAVVQGVACLFIIAIVVGALALLLERR